MESGWYSAVLFVLLLLLLPGCLKQNQIAQNDFSWETVAFNPPDVERSYVQMVTHLEDNTGAIVAVGDNDK